MKCVIVNHGQECSQVEYNNELVLVASKKPNPYGQMFYLGPRVRLAIEEPITDYYFICKEGRAPVIGIRGCKPLENEITRVLKVASTKIGVDINGGGNPLTPELSVQTFEQGVFLPLSKLLHNPDWTFRTTLPHQIPRDHNLHLAVDLFGVFLKNNKVYIEGEVREFRAFPINILRKINVGGGSDNNPFDEWATAATTSVSWI